MPKGQVRLANGSTVSLELVWMAHDEHSDSMTVHAIGRGVRYSTAPLTRVEAEAICDALTNGVSSMNN